MARKTPILLRRGPVSGRVQAVHRYSFTNDGQTLKATMDGKQDVHDDFESLALSWLMDNGAEDIVAILDGAADGEALNDEERGQVRIVRERIRKACERHNARLLALSTQGDAA